MTNTKGKWKKNILVLAAVLLLSVIFRNNYYLLLLFSTIGIGVMVVSGLDLLFWLFRSDFFRSCCILLHRCIYFRDIEYDIFFPGLDKYVYWCNTRYGISNSHCNSSGKACPSFSGISDHILWTTYISICC